VDVKELPLPHAAQNSQRALRYLVFRTEKLLKDANLKFQWKELNGMQVLEKRPLYQGSALARAAASLATWGLPQRRRWGRCNVGPHP